MKCMRHIFKNVTSSIISACSSQRRKLIYIHCKLSITELASISCTVESQVNGDGRHII